MSQNPADQSPKNPKIHFVHTADFREGYANSVQIRMSLWDFQLNFGTIRQDTPDEVTFQAFQGVYMSPQQAKALWSMLGQNLAQYEAAFGVLKLEPTSAESPVVIPVPPLGGPVN